MKDFIGGFVLGIVFFTSMVFKFGFPLCTEPIVVTDIDKKFIEVNGSYFFGSDDPTRYQIGDTLQLMNTRIIETYGFRTF